MSMRVAVLLAMIAPNAALAAAREPEQLALQGKWVANYDRDACHLIAQFGTGEDAVYARFVRYQPQDSFNLDLISKRLRSFEARSDAKIAFGLGPVEKQNVLRGTVGERAAVYFRGLRVDGWTWRREGDTPPPITPEQEKRVNGVTVTVPGTRPFRLVFPALDKPMAAMRNCMTDLVKSWGYDPAADAALTQRAKPVDSPGNWLHAADYPSAALRGGHNGVVQFRLDIDAAGKIAGCYILARTSPDDFADHTCRLITKRAKFEPARDAANQPVRSYFIQRVQWQVGV